MNLTDGATFPTTLIKRVKNRVNQKINLPCDTKRRIRETAINNVWNTQLVQILHAIRDKSFLSKVNLISGIPKPVDVTHELMKKIFKYQEP